MPALMPRLAVIVASALSIACVGPFGSKAASAASCPSGEVWMPAQVSADGLGGRVRIEVSEEVGHCVAVGGLDKTEVNDPGRPAAKLLPPFMTDRVRVSACVEGRPDANGRAPEDVDMCSFGSDTCNDELTPIHERRWNFRVWERRRFGPPAYNQVGEWEPAGFECYRPGEVPESTVSDVPVRVVTWVDVYNAIRNEPAARKRVTVQPAVRTLVNLDTIVYTDSSDWAKNDIPLLGFSVDVKATPTAYRWDFGDGSKLTTKSAGRPYPAKDVTHRYLHRSDRVATSVSTTYRASFSVNGGAWQPIDQPLTVTGPATAVAVREAVPVLVAPDR
jgi:hypothetical protein